MLRNFFLPARRDSHPHSPTESKGHDDHSPSPDTHRHLTPKQILEQNKAWAAEMEATHPGFFADLAKGQTPEYLWIGCSDSRVPPNVVLGMDPGELFVHRNIANCVYSQDLNVLGALQYAVEVLHVKYILVVGHYGCGGVRAAMSDEELGTLDNWLRPIKDLFEAKERVLASYKTEEQRTNAMVEFNVIKSVESVCHSTSVRKAWKAGQELHVLGWVYNLENGIMKDLKAEASGPKDLAHITSLLAPGHHLQH
ncbi:hypothetical protein HDU93_004012 [Gonapodya sp. JEL0774]|nr:hypothetical protein HDU93_004012 [Gonapodya sp. JEL0774]